MALRDRPASPPTQHHPCPAVLPRGALVSEEPLSVQTDGFESSLRDYVSARITEGRHQLRERRRRLLPELRARGADLSSADLTSAGVLLLEDLLDRSLRDVPPAYLELLQEFRAAEARSPLGQGPVSTTVPLGPRRRPPPRPSPVKPTSGPGLDAPRSVAVAALAVVLAIGLGVLEVPALLGYSSVFRPLAPEAISDQIVLVTWDRTHGEGGAEEGGPDFTEFADHRSYRVTHPTVLGQIAQAGASVVLLDAWIRGGDTGAVDGVAAAVASARTQGCEVVVPARRDGGRWDFPSPAIVEAATAVGFGAAMAEGPTRLERQARMGYATTPSGAPRWSVAVLVLAALQGSAPSWTSADTIRVGTQTVQTDRGLRLIRFPSRPDYRRYSYADIYYGRFDPEHFKEAIVLLGSTQGGQDMHRTPVGPRYGVQVQADLLNGLLVDELVAPVGWLARMGLAFLFAALMGALVSRARRRQWPRASTVVLAALHCLLAAALSWSLMDQGQWWPWTDVVVLAVLVFGWELRRGRAQPGLLPTV